VTPGWGLILRQDNEEIRAIITRSRKSLYFIVVSRAASPGEMQRSHNRMKAESLAINTFAPPSSDINIRYAYLYSYDDQLQVSHIPEQYHSMEVS